MPSVFLSHASQDKPSNWVKEEWTDAFWEQINNRRAKLAGVLYRDCQDLRTNHPEGLRQITTWLLTEQPAPPPRINLLPTRPAIFIGPEADIEYWQNHSAASAVV